MKKISCSVFILFFLFFIFQTALAQQERYSRVKIYADANGLKELSQAGICIDHGEIKRNVFFISDFSEKEIELIKSKGFNYEILIDDVRQFYKDQNNPSSDKYVPPAEVQTHGCNSVINFPTPSNFSLGSMGGFFTYSEILWHLDNMANQFPNLIKARTAISATNSIEGRPIYWLKISDNPNVDEAEPEILYDALHHAREPASVSQLIMYMYYLLENYNTNSEVKYLVDNLEMYFVPCVNPDGYIYNETTDPGGGGMWRKNRRNNGDGTFGIDLNRNYGYNWGYDNIGSSPNTFSDTYRGTAPFSEPETQVMRDFCNAHQFQLTLNYHTYGNLLIYPWGYDYSIFTPDSATFVEFAKFLTWQNHYNFGTGDQTVGYIVNGDSDDWMYGEQSSKPKIFAMTPEAGEVSYGFWPPQNLIIDICKENITQNLHAAHLLLNHAVATDDEPRYVSATNGFFNYKLKQLGLGSPATFTVSITPLSANITSAGSPKIYSSLSLLQEVSDSISFTLGTITEGQVLKYIISADNGGFINNDTIEKIYGTPVIAFSSNGNSISGWNSTGWGTDNSSFHSPSSSISDSPGSFYNSNENNRITLASSINLNNTLSATLSFWARWEIEPRFDYVQALASSDGGSTWDVLCGKYTKTGTAYQDPGNPVYDGFIFGWVHEEIDLDSYVNQNILLRFRLISDNGSEYDGFFFDDLKVEKIMNTTSVNELGVGSGEFEIYPNPTSGVFQVKSQKSKVKNVEIHNVLGEKVYESVVSRQSSVVQQPSTNNEQLATNIDLSEAPSGIYFVKVTDEKGNLAVRKIVLQ